MPPPIEVSLFGRRGGMQQMNCREINEYLSAYLDNELEATISLSIAKHLEQCRGCTEELRRMTEVSTLIKKSVISADEKDLTKQERASSINERVRNIISTSSDMRADDPPSLEMLIPQAQAVEASNIAAIERKKKSAWMKRAALAASVLIAFSLLGIV